MRETAHIGLSILNALQWYIGRGNNIRCLTDTTHEHPPTNVLQTSEHKRTSPKLRNGFEFSCYTETSQSVETTILLECNSKHDAKQRSTILLGINGMLLEKNKGVVNIYRGMLDILSEYFVSLQFHQFFVWQKQSTYTEIISIFIPFCRKCGSVKTEILMQPH